MNRTIESRASLPVVDLHCDLLAYLGTVEGARPEDVDDIGCAAPLLQQGCVRLQVLASYVATEATSASVAETQYRWFDDLVSQYSHDFVSVTTVEQALATLQGTDTGVVLAVENASGLCTEDEALDLALARLDQLLERVGRVLYITLTHHGENRFGGGNQTSIGLKDDGRALLDHLDGKKVAVDMSHTSDKLARDVLDHIDRGGLRVPVVASHSNFRALCDHPRNLPDELAKEIVSRGGVIGVNFVRAFVHPDDPSYLKRHILHGFGLGLGDALCFGADFFFWKGHRDHGRVPFYHPGQEHAGRYQQILESLVPELDVGQRRALACENALRVLQRVWI